jgi:HK97 family phage major capsid protein
VHAPKAGNGGRDAALEFARFTGSGRVIDAFERQKAAIAAGTTSDSAWAAPLAYASNVAAEFVALERAQSILGRINARRVPFNCRFGRVQLGTSVAWVRQGGPLPVTDADFDTVTLGITKVGGVAIVTRELAESSSPAAAAVLSADLAASSAAFMDRQLIDPDVAAVANESPASITHGLSAIPSSGSTCPP